MPDLPRPRDRAEREKMLAAFDAGQNDVRARIGGFPAVTGIFEDVNAAEAAVPAALPETTSAGVYDPTIQPIPPVSEASREGMPELAENERWGTLDKYGHFVSSVDEADARSDAAMFDDTHPEDGPHRVVRLAVVEVVEPEPEQAPSGWRYEVEECGAHHWRQTNLVAFDGDKRLWSLNVKFFEESRPEIPPIDREYVARLLGGNE